jgi:hypothetical protein
MQRQYGNRYVQRLVARAKEEEGEAEVSPDVEEAIERKRGGGQPLEDGVRAQMESAFDSDFSGVRVHTDAEADALSRGLGARAFTTGRDIFFRQGAYSPDNSSGRELLAHELTHVVQQRGGIQPRLAVGPPGDKYEQEAEKTSQAWLQPEGQVSKEQASGHARIQLARQGKRRRQRDPVKAARDLRTLLERTSVNLESVETIVVPEDVPDTTSWLRQIEKEYNLLCGRKPSESGGMTQWVPAQSYGGTPTSHGEKLVKLVVRSPLREHLEEKLGEDAKDLVSSLDQATPTGRLTLEQRLQRVWRPKAEALLATDDRAFAIEQAKLMNANDEETWSQGLTPPVLAEWLFSDAVWPVMWGLGYKIRYHTAEGGTHLYIQRLVREHRSNWRSGGAVSFLEAFAKRLSLQVALLSENLHLFTSPLYTYTNNWQHRLPGAKRCIIAYEASWRNVGDLSGTLETIQSSIVAPGPGKEASKFIKSYLWSERRRADELDDWTKY